MKKSTLSLMLALLTVLFLGACGGGDQAGSKETEEETTSEAPATTEDPILTMNLGSVTEIEDWVGLIAVALNENQFVVTNPVMVPREGKTYEASVVNPEGRVKIVRAATPNWENPEMAFRYFMRDGQVILLESGRKTAGGYVLERFYYGNGQLLKANTRSGATLAEAGSAVPQDLTAAEGDFRTNFNEVQARGNQFLADATKGE